MYLLASNDTTYQSYCTYIPQKHGVVERKHKHIVETEFSFEVPNTFWEEEPLTSVYMINWIRTSPKY